jgi:hypothetical protein
MMPRWNGVGLAVAMALIVFGVAMLLLAILR